jgi:hypothetical protein
MSSAVVSTSAALGRPFLFDAESEPEACPLSNNKKPADKQKLPITQVFQSTIKNQQSTIPLVTPASHLAIRPTPEMVASGIPALDALTGGLPRGCLTEICGPASCGRTSVMLAALAAVTRRNEYCAVIDASDALDPLSLAAAGVDLDRLLWVRCDENSPRRHRDSEKTNGRKEFIANNALDQGTIGKNTPENNTNGKGAASAVPNKPHIDPALAAEGHRFRLKLFKQTETGQIFKTRSDKGNGDGGFRNRKHSEHRLEQVLRATDLLLESGGFGLIVLDLADVPFEAARRIPLTTWFRFRRAVEHKPTIVLAIEQQPIAGSCSSLLLKLEVLSSQFSVRSSNQNPADQNFASRARDPKPSYAQLLTELKINAELIRSRLDRKPARSVAFAVKTAWAG